MLTILIGMSASGKDAILRELVANHGFREIVTTTTRPMRKGEVNGKDYNFISRKEFEKGISEGRFKVVKTPRERRESYEQSCEKCIVYVPEHSGKIRYHKKQQQAD